MHDKRNYPFYPILKVSVPSFGDSFLSSVILEESAEEKEKFPSPHSGILFYVEMQIGYNITSICFRPLIRGFFFIWGRTDRCKGLEWVFPSPHSGILFYNGVVGKPYAMEMKLFPSPHSGILFYGRKRT